MAENAGSIEYDVIADTSGLLKAESSVDKSTQNIANDFTKIDKAAKKTGLEVTKSSKAVKGAMAGVGRGAGQAGIQFQQFIGQIQGGQSAMLALSQQSADLGFVLGMPLAGAVVGIAASLGGILLPELFKTTGEMRALTELLPQLTSEFNKLSETQQSVARNVLTEKIKEQAKEANGLRKQINEVQSTLVTVSNASRGNFLFDLFGDSPEKLQKELTQLKGSLAATDLEIKKTIKARDELGNNKELTEGISSITTSLESQIIALRDGEEASFRYSVAQQLNLKSGEQIPENINKQIEALFKLTQAKDAAAKADAARDKAAREAERAEQSQKRAEELAGSKAESFAGGIIDRGMTDAERLQADMDKLTSLREQNLINTQLYEEAKTSIEQTQAAERERIKAEEAKAEEQRAQLILASSGELFGGIAELLKSSGDEQSNAYKAMFAISKGFAIAQAGINLHTAISQASVLPFPANIPAMTAAAASGASLVSAISSASYAGGRQFGGSVNANSMYRVGEAGPEIFQTKSGQNMMIPGENGKVLSNSDSMAAMNSGPMEVVVNNYGSPMDVKVSQTDKQLIVDLSLKAVANQINSNQGVIPKALNNGSNYRTKANR